MLGAIAGDMIGRPYEIYPVKYKDFILFSDNAAVTDDTVMTCAVACAVLRSRPFAYELRAWFAGSCNSVAYGERFQAWATSGTGGDSRGNGAAMRVSSLAWLAPDLATAMAWAAESARPSHDHPEAITAAQAVVAAARLGIEGHDLAFMKNAIETVYGYDLTTPLEIYREDYFFELTAAATVTPSLRAVIEATSFEDALRNAISMGGDADTMAAIAGGVAEAFFPIPDDIRAFVDAKLPPAVREVLDSYNERRSQLAGTAAASSITPEQSVIQILTTALQRAINKPSTTPVGWRRMLAMLGIR